MLYGLQRNPAADVSKIKLAYDQASFDFYSPEEVWALARAANDEQDAAIYLIWRDIDFEKRAICVETNVVAGRVGPTKAAESGIETLES